MTATATTLQPELALIRVTGKDARSFLHAQTTQALKDLPATGHRLAAWLNAKGRVRALFEVVADDDTLWLVLPADNRDYVVSELGRYVLRADVKLEAADAVNRPESLVNFDSEPTDIGTLEEIRRGIPMITAALRERYVPQMLNLDRLDAVSFTKGCYPGQEIVARAANLGEVKRRIRHFSTAAGERPAIGDAIVTGDGKSAGEINRVAANGIGFEVLAVVPIDAEPLNLESGQALIAEIPPAE